MNRIVHFEIPATDPKKSLDFYAEAFGWKYQEFPGFDYWIATTGEDSKPGINGALMKRRDPGQPMTIVIDVPNIDESMATVEKLGGQIVVPKMPIPGMGYSAYFKDPDGVIMGLWQLDANAK